MLYTLVYTFSIVVLLKENHALYTCLYFFNCGIVKRKPCFIHLSILFQLWYCEKKTMLYTLVCTFSIVVLLKENHALYTCLYFFNCGIVKRKPCFIHLSVLFQLWYC